MKYLAIVRNYCSPKTAHVQAEHKYTTKANLHIRIQTSYPSLFRYNVNEMHGGTENACKKKWPPEEHHR